MKRKNFKIKCRMCKKIYKVAITQQEIDDYNSGMLIQNAFPLLNTTDRELVKTQTCHDCFEDIFKNTED